MEIDAFYDKTEKAMYCIHGHPEKNMHAYSAFPFDLKKEVLEKNYLFAELLFVFYKEPVGGIQPDVYAVTDRYGSTPIYIWDTPERLHVATRIDSFFKHGLKPKENKSYTAQWLTFNNCLTRETMFEGVTRLEKGTILHLNTGEKTKYWEWKLQPEKMTYNEAKLQLRALLTQAIERRKSLNYGACLSGGVDSNIINLFTGDCFTFTAGFSQGNDERSISDLHGKQHYNVVFNKLRHFEESIRCIETPLVGASWSNVGLMALVRKFTNELFDGSGADELFMNYHWRYDMTKDYYDIVNRTGVPFCRELFKEIYPEDTLENRFMFDYEFFLESVLQVCSKIAAQFNIKLLCPFLDNDFVDFVLKIPIEYKMNKKILKDAFPELPEICKGDKKGFSSPDFIGGPDNPALNWANAAVKTWRKIYG
jgi:asparagine synthase (glutamine-hydrolysing)